MKLHLIKMTHLGMTIEFLLFQKSILDILLTLKLFEIKLKLIAALDELMLALVYSIPQLGQQSLRVEAE